MQRKASAHWQGSTQEGSGTLSAQSGTLKDTPYSFKARFGDGKGTNPEELIAAAHAGCFTMALSFTLNNAGFTADVIDTEARADDGPGRRQADDHRRPSRRRARSVPGIDAAKFAEIASAAKTGCVVSRALSPSITVTLDAALAS